MAIAVHSQSTALTPAVQRLGIFLLPKFSLASMASCTELYAVVNQLLAVDSYEVVLISETGAPVTSSCGLVISVHTAMANVGALGSLLVLSASPLPQRGFENVIAWLRGINHRILRDQNTGVPTLGGIGTGAYLLARAGLLGGLRATIDWTYATLFAEDFPTVIVSSNLFELDGASASCPNGAAVLDMLLEILRRSHDADLVAEVIEHFGIERARAGSENQRVPISARIGGGQPKLTEAVALMEANFEEPLPTEEIARLVGVSRRQLERLFKQYLDSLPSRYYLQLRLNRSRQLLQQTSQSILQIGLSCGFSSGPHFSSAYRAHFEVTPREQRNQRFVRDNQFQHNGVGAAVVSERAEPAGAAEQVGLT